MRSGSASCLRRSIMVRLRESRAFAANSGFTRRLICSGPLSNPAGAPRQIIGVWRKDLAEKLAEVLAALGTERAWVVHGDDGLDEITLAGKTHVAEAVNGRVRTFEIGPEDFGFEARALDHLRGGDTDANAEIVNAVLAGERKDEAARVGDNECGGGAFRWRGCARFA